jgi:hypothetical protein
MPLISLENMGILRSKKYPFRARNVRDPIPIVGSFTLHYHDIPFYYWRMRKQILLPLIAMLFPLLLSAQERSANQLDIQSLFREVEAKQKENSAKMERYSHTLKRTVQELNDKGEVKKEKVYLYQVFPRRQALPVILLLSEDGKALSDEKLAKERIRVNKYWQEHKNDAPKTKPGTETPWFQLMDFSIVGNERYEGRDVVVLSFKPRADSVPKNDGQKFLSGLKGQVWIDPAEKVIMKMQAELTNVFSVGGLKGLFSSLRPGSVLTIENMPIGDGLWGGKRLEFGFIEKYPGVLLLPKTARTRNLDELSDYRPFDPEA